MQLNWVPAVTALLPALGIHASYLLAAAHGHVPWCLIYLEGCSSISATGRTMPGRAVFLGTVLPGAFLLILYWRLNAAWLEHLRGRPARSDRAVAALGLLSGLGLIVYLTVLGAPGPEARALRRVAIAVFFVALYAAQVALTWQLVKLVSAASWLWILVGLCALVFIGAVLNLVLLAAGEDLRDVEDAFEWSLTMVIFAHLLATGTAWRRSGFAARL